MRLVKAVLLVGLLLGAFAGVAQALDFNDEGEDAPPGEIGRIYHFAMPSHGGCDDAPYRYVVESGQLPPGLKLGNLSPRAGLIDGIPTESGTWSAWIALKDHCGQSAELLYTFEIGRRSYGITTTGLPPATLGGPYAAKLAACCHPALSVAWSVSSGSLPAGLTLAPDGTIAGIPTGSGGASTFTASVRANGDDGEIRADSRQLTITVAGGLTLGASRRVGEVGVGFRSTLSATGGQAPYTWSTTGLPPGVSLVGSTLAGTPTRAGSFTAQVTGTDAQGVTKTADVALRVLPRLAITTGRLRPARAGAAYRVSLSPVGGLRPLKWSLARGSFPTGMRLGSSTGLLSGRAVSGGTARVTVRVRDALGAVATRTFVLSVRS